MRECGVRSSVALIDTYRSNIARKQGELINLQKARSGINVFVFCTCHSTLACSFDKKKSRQSKR